MWAALPASPDDFALALISAAERFSDAGRELFLDFLPGLSRWEPITDLVGGARLGLRFWLPDGRELVLEVSMRKRRQWVIGGAVTLDDEDVLRLPDAPADDPSPLLAAYADQLLGTARWHIGEALGTA